MRLRLFLCILLAWAWAWAASASAAEAAMPTACMDPASATFLRPLGQTHAPPPYPEISQRLGEHGVTAMQMTIDKYGVPLDITLKTSSGSPRLDDSALTYVRDFWRWSPLPEMCQVTGAEALISVVWNLHETTFIRIDWPILYPEGDDYPAEFRNQKEEGVVSVTVRLSTKGAVLGTQLSRGSGLDDLDAKALEIVARQKFEPGRVNGRPAETYVGVTVAFLLKGPASPAALSPLP